MKLSYVFNERAPIFADAHKALEARATSAAILTI
jgi:hypothetical protein